MAWRIKFSKTADKAMTKLDIKTAQRIFAELEKVTLLEDPRSLGRALTGNLVGLWRYRVGNYRIICDIEDEDIVILVVDIAPRSRVYKRRR